MNYYQARQRTDGRWDFTCMNDGQIHPVGYCHAYRPWTAEVVRWHADPEHAEEEAARLEAEQAPFREKYHADGHATAEEADRCWYEYELDDLRPVTYDGAQYPCAVCGAWTQQGLRSRHETSRVLCADHANREGFAQAKPFHPGIRIASSW